MNDFNLIVSTYRHREEDAQDELLDLLEMFGDPEVESEITEISGIILVLTRLDPLHAVERLRKLISSEPWQVRYILRVLPVQAVAPTELEAIKETVKRLASGIGSGDTFRVTVEKRHTLMESKQVISAIAGEIDSKVDLENPDWVVLVEILGRQTGVSVLKQSQIFSSVVEKRKG